MKFDQEKKSAIKLLNQYAEQYKRIELENKALNEEISDLKKNLKISKEIIEGFFKPEQKEKSKIFLKKTKEEILLLNASLQKTRKDLKEARDKITYYEISFGELMKKNPVSIEEFENKVFYLENLLKKKEAIICYLNLKMNKLFQSIYVQNEENNQREIILIDPSPAMILMNNELYINQYKLNEASQKLSEAQNKIKELSLEIEQMKLGEYSNSSGSCGDDSVSSPEKKDNFYEKIKRMIEKNDINNLSLNKPEKNWEIDEWKLILKKSKLTPEIISKLSQTRVGESLEILVKIIMEKNMQIRVISKENDNLNEKNATLSNENSSLLNQILQLKKDIKTHQKFQSNFDYSITLNDNDKRKFEQSIIEEKNKQFKVFEKYLDEYTSKSQVLDEQMIENEIKECYKSFVTNDSTLKKKVDFITGAESFITEELCKNNDTITSSIKNNE